MEGTLSYTERESDTRFLTSSFLNQFPPTPEFPVRAISHFLKLFAEIFESKGFSLVSMTLVTNEKMRKCCHILLICCWVAVYVLIMIFFTQCSLWHVGKLILLQLFITSVVDTGDNKVSRRCYRWLIITGVVVTCDKLIADVMESIIFIASNNDTDDNLSPMLLTSVNSLSPTTPAINTKLWISPRILFFAQIQNGSNRILRGPGETDLWKKHEVKSHVRLPFMVLHISSGHQMISNCSPLIRHFK